MIESVWMIPLGFAAGVLGSIIGLGGGIIIIPVLVFFGFPPTAAASNSLFAAFANASASTVSYWRQQRIEYATGLRLGLMAVPGTVVGAYASAGVAPDIFKILFGLVLVSSAVYMFAQKQVRQTRRSGPAVLVLAMSVSFFTGIISSFFGIGGGIVFVPLMVAAMGLTMRRAAPTSQFILLFTSFAGMVSHSALGHPDYTHALFLAMGAAAGGLVGARLSLDIREGVLRIIIAAAIIGASIKLFADGLL